MGACWVVTDGVAGHENQALGLAEAIARLHPNSITVKRVAIADPWRRLPASLWGDPFTRLDRVGAMLRPPFPDLWIGCGRTSAPFGAAVRRRAPETFVVHLQDPQLPLDRFDLVAPPRHDGLKGANVVPTLGAPNRIVSERLRADAERFARETPPPRSPRVVVLVGGALKGRRIDARGEDRLVDGLRRLADAGAGLMISPSRRTSPRLVDRLASLRDAVGATVWSGDRLGGLDNPYHAFLGLADLAVVTADSVSMASEAATAGLPVYIHYWSENRRAGLRDKHRAFHRALEAAGAARPFDGAINSWAYEPLRETERLAGVVVDRWRNQR